MNGAFEVRAAGPGDRAWMRATLHRRWGGDTVAGHGRVFRPAELDALIVRRDGGRVGIVTYVIDDGGLEIVTIDSLEPRQGVGTALVEAAVERAREAGCSRLWLVTTNDNATALSFYAGRGFRIVAVREGAVARLRELKPSIPLTGEGGVPIEDEIELEIPL